MKGKIVICVLFSLLLALAFVSCDNGTISKSNVDDKYTVWDVPNANLSDIRYSTLLTAFIDNADPAYVTIGDLYKNGVWLYEDGDYVVDDDGEKVVLSGTDLKTKIIDAFFGDGDNGGVAAFIATWRPVDNS
jgi:hypothetical protein